VAEKSVPKMTMISAARNGGAVSTRTLIPHKSHHAIRVLGAAPPPAFSQSPDFRTGEYSCWRREDAVQLASDRRDVGGVDDGGDQGEGVAVLRTARKLFDGFLFAD
jgi:4-oxalomesaconate tautomerase